MKEESLQTRQESIPAVTNDTPVTDVSLPDFPSLTQTAKAIAQQHNVSLRTAYRHLARGTRPATERRVGRDNKSYPALPRCWRPDRPPLQRELALTWQALNRADKRAVSDGISDADITVLRRIGSMTQEMLIRWEGATQLE